MINPEFLINGVLREVMGGRRKKSKNALKYLTGKKGGWLTHPQTLLTAAGLAWGVYETLNQGSSGSQGQWGGGGAAGPGPSPQGVPPLPNVPGATAVAAVENEAVRMVRLAISAAHADGTFSEREHAAILQQAQAAGAGELVESELRQPRPVAEIVAGITDRAQAATLYVLAYTVLRADEQVSGAERIYLAQLANLLGLAPPDVEKLEKDVGERINALGDQGQPGG